jgi:L-methionine (R)-S-oxide reductase
MSHSVQDLQTWLSGFVTKHGGVAGTVHVLTQQPTGPILSVAASLNIPPPVVEATRLIPKGKGMAGLAWERGEAVQTCNLATDESGDVRPGAKAVNAQAAVAIPVNGADSSLRAVVGIAFLGEREFSDEEIANLRADASGLPE